MPNAFHDDYSKVCVGPVNDVQIQHARSGGGTYIKPVDEDEFDCGYEDWLRHHRSNLFFHVAEQIAEGVTQHMMTPAVPLSVIEELLYQEASCVDPGDVPLLMQVFCTAAEAHGGSHPDIDKMAEELEQQLDADTDED